MGHPRHADEVIGGEDGKTNSRKMFKRCTFCQNTLQNYQHNINAPEGELEKRSFRRMGKVSGRAMVLCFVIYLCMGIPGYLLFGNDTQNNILRNLAPYTSDWAVALGFAAITITVTLAYPLNIFPVRFTMETIIFYRFPGWIGIPDRVALTGGAKPKGSGRGATSGASGVGGGTPVFRENVSGLPRLGATGIHFPPLGGPTETGSSSVGSEDVPGSGSGRSHTGRSHTGNGSPRTEDADDPVGPSTELSDSRWTITGLSPVTSKEPSRVSSSSSWENLGHCE